MATGAIETVTIRFYQAKGKYAFLSCLFKRPVVFENIEFDCREKAYQWGKFANPAAAEWMRQAPEPHLAAIVGHGLFKWDIAEGWAAKKIERMRQVLLAFFRQHEDLRKQLFDTGDALLLEDSNMDAFWGLGPKGNGKNMLGKLLMEVREKLRGG